MKVQVYRPGLAGYGEAGSEVAEPPSRALWFVLGALAVWTGPTLLSIFHAGGGYAKRRIDAR